jgi:hypothetical protein
MSYSKPRHPASFGKSVAIPKNTLLEFVAVARRFAGGGTQNEATNVVWREFWRNVHNLASSALADPPLAQPRWRLRCEPFKSWDTETREARISILAARTLAITARMGGGIGHLRFPVSSFAHVAAEYVGSIRTSPRLLLEAAPPDIRVLKALSRTFLTESLRPVPTTASPVL